MPLARTLENSQHLHASSHIRCKIVPVCENGQASTSDDFSCTHTPSLPPALSQQRGDAFISWSFFQKLRKHSSEIPQLDQAALTCEGGCVTPAGLSPGARPRLAALGKLGERFDCQLGIEGAECKLRGPMKVLTGDGVVDVKVEDGVGYFTKGFLEEVVGSKEKEKAGGIPMMGAVDGDARDPCWPLGSCDDLMELDKREEQETAYKPVSNAAGTVTIVKFIAPTATRYITPTAQPSQTPNVDELLSQISSLVHAPSFTGRLTATDLVSSLSAAVTPGPAPQVPSLTGAPGVYGRRFATTAGEDLAAGLFLLGFAALLCLLRLVVWPCVKRMIPLLAPRPLFPAHRSLRGQVMPTAEDIAIARVVVRSCVGDYRRSKGPRKTFGLRVRRPARGRKAVRGRALSLKVSATVLSKESSDRELESAGDMRRSNSQISLGSDVSIISSTVTAENGEAWELLEEDMGMPSHVYGS